MVGHCIKHPELLVSDLVLWKAMRMVDRAQQLARPTMTKLLVYVPEGSWDKL